MKKYKLLKNEKIDTKNFNSHIERESRKHSSLKKRNTTKERSRTIEKVTAKILDYYFKNSKKVLCVGCRDDSEVDLFNSNNVSAIGIDIANETSKIKKIPAEKIDQVFNEKEFDFVYASHSLEHVILPELVLKNIRHVSSKGCYVILPLEVRNEPGADHPVIFDISKQHKHSSRQELISSIEEDFKNFEPYEVEDVFYFEFDKNKYLPEFHICFKWK